MTQARAASHQLLQTKLAPPRLRNSLIVRPALLARLDDGLERKLTLISAPAGFGKTTLVSQWIADLRLQVEDWRTTGRAINDQQSTIRNQVAWLALDEGDNDPARFWRYVIAACQMLDEGIGAAALALLQPSPQPPYEAVLNAFLNDLASWLGRLVLVLEDYHAITAPSIHEGLAFLLDHLPPTLHLVLMTRSDPPLPLARLRARDEVNELRAADLRFSLPETTSFLQQALPIPLTDEAVQRLDTRTEGWAAGLRLVALALQASQRQTEVDHFLATFSGSHRHILEYLVAEVLAAQPEPLQTFLLQTSILHVLTASLCNAVTGRIDSALVLEQLERANLFLTPLADAPQPSLMPVGRGRGLGASVPIAWYRYHALFAEAMHQLARRRLGEQALRDLYHKAGFWYEQAGLLGEAVEAAVAAQDFTQAAHWIERLVADQRFYRELLTLRRWLDQFPEAVLRAHPNLALHNAVAILFTEDRRAPATSTHIEVLLALAEPAWQATSNHARLGEVLALRALVAWWQGDWRLAFAAARQALAQLPADEVQWRATCLISLGMEELLAGRLASAQQAVLEARALCEAADNIHGVMAATLILGQVFSKQGDLSQAAQVYRQVHTIASDVNVGEPLDDRVESLLGLGRIVLERNDLATAQAIATEALAISSDGPAVEMTAYSSLFLARVEHARGETTQAQQRLDTLALETALQRWPIVQHEVRTCQAQLAVAAGDLATVEQWQRHEAQRREDVPRLLQEDNARVIAQLLIAQEEAEAALTLLEPWLADARAQGRGWSELQLMVLVALAYFSNGEISQAQETLMRALALAHSQGYQRLFLDHGEPMRLLLAECRLRMTDFSLRAYADQLLAAFANTSQSRSPAPILNPQSTILNPIEPLSRQERRVLRLLAAGLSNPEIARELVVSINTVKTQVQSIFRKLNVNSRAEARAAARHLRLPG